MDVESEPVPVAVRQLCRLCLSQETELVDIFSVQQVAGNAESLTERIHGCLQLEVNQNDNLPKWICRQCMDKIDDFASFRERCKQNERTLLRGEGIGPANVEMPCYNEEDEQTDEEETEMIVIDPSKEYESSNDSLPNDSYGEKNGDLYFPGMDGMNEAENLPSNADDEEAEGTDADEGEEEEEEEDEDDLKCDTLVEGARNGLSHAGNTSSTPQKPTIYTCKYCDVAFAASSACQLHEMQDHDLLAPYGCMYCPYKTAIRMSLIAHIRESHSIMRPYICVQCNKGFLRRSDLKKHTFVHTGVRPYACEQCGKSFSRNTNLKKHERTHSGLKPHSCELCSRSFANKADLVRHRNLHVEHERNQFACIRCGTTYTQKDKLYDHEQYCLGRQSMHGPFSERKSDVPAAPLLYSPTAGPFLVEDIPDSEAKVIKAASVAPALPPSHVPEAPPSNKVYNCTKCPKRFLSKASLRAHQSTHSSEDTRRYECPQCRKTFVGKRELEQHLLTHPEIKPFGCATCGKRFSRKDKLQRHQRIHQRDRHYSCPNCAAKFVRRDALTSHLKIHCTGTTARNIDTAPTMTPGMFSAMDQGQGMGIPMALHQRALMYSVIGDDAGVVDPAFRM
ncbi:zinc finger protein 26-like [Anopheles nili]|uniref:zinc finger protein 26-like n=1 Tax=Anopheles nili TaxID=185578 RepID=UPI00237AD88F|nr:zinc finger protein 26-like [Anopheles nili]